MRHFQIWQRFFFEKFPLAEGGGLNLQSIRICDGSKPQFRDDTLAANDVGHVAPTYVCMYVFMYACMHACMHVCILVIIFTHTHT